METVYGFSVFQPAIGSALQWLPALGTPELDEMIHAFIPGPSSIQDKRAHVSMDFFEFSRLTGKNFKYYPVPSSFTSATTASPASSASLYDSGYSSSFNASPVVSSMGSWTQSPATAFTPSFSTGDETRTKSRAAPSRKSTASSSRQQTTDFANHPGMRIMTKDGQDVTNSASRGCKTKEQRDHAHLMRIIKACDACKRKKIRCDPSHKKRTASQASVASPQAEQKQKPAKKAKKASKPPPTVFDPAYEFMVPNFFNNTEAESPSSPFESSPESTDDLWSQFVLFDQEPYSLTDNLPTEDFDLFNDTQGGFTPTSSNTSASPWQFFSPSTPAPPGPSPPVLTSESVTSEVLPGASPQDLTVPYLNPDVAHGTNYVDFNLYSPPADFFLDEEPLPSKKALASGGSQQRQSPQPSGLPDGLFESYETLQERHASESTEVAHSAGYYSSPSSRTSHGGSQQSAAKRPDEHIHASTSVTVSHADQSAYLYDQVYDGDGVPASLASSTSRSSPAISSIADDQLAIIRGSSFSSRPLSVDQRPTVATHSAAVPCAPRAAPTRPQELARPHDVSVAEATQHYSHTTSTVAIVSGERREQYCSMMSASSVTTQPSLTPSSILPEGRGRCGVSSGASSGGAGALAVNAALATMLVATSPTRRLVDGETGDGQPQQPSSSLSQLVVFGLVSSLLAISLQTQLVGTQADLEVCLNVLIVTSMVIASLLQRRGEMSMSQPTTILMPPSTGTIGNVKTKIQALGQRMYDFRCAVSQRLGTFVPRLHSQSSIKF